MHTYTTTQSSTSHVLHARARARASARARVLVQVGIRSHTGPCEVKTDDDESFAMGRNVVRHEALGRLRSCQHSL